MRPGFAVMGFVLGAALSGCAAMDAAPAYDGADLLRHFAAPPVEVLDGAPVRPYRVIAKLEASSGRRASSADLVVILRAQAARLGADAVFPVETRTSSLDLDDDPWFGSYRKSPDGPVPVAQGYAITYRSQ